MGTTINESSIICDIIQETIHKIRGQQHKEIKRGCKNIALKKKKRKKLKALNSSNTFVPPCFLSPRFEQATDSTEFDDEGSLDPPTLPFN